MTYNKIIAGLIILIGLLLIYSSIDKWYCFHYPRAFTLSWDLDPEIAHPLRLMASIVTCFYGIRLFLEKIEIKTAVALSILTIVGVDFVILFFLCEG
jgi:hypothetical protein